MEQNNLLRIQPETIENVYDLHTKDRFLVNRRYQRKLVWTIEEKEGFIDSISLQYPVPLFLVAEVNYKGGKRYEIIDGMQRLEAIISFINGDIALDGKYFDLEATASTKYLLDENKLTQKNPKLDRETCKKIANYQIPISISSFSDEHEIDLIFKRINANGKHLSKQELRQAGSDTRFAYIVRKLAENIRGDISTDDKTLLVDMRKVSINNKELDYGINLGGIFWRKHNIVTKDNIRESKDEELIAHILTSILITPSPSATSTNLDEYYGLRNGANKTMEDQIKKLGEEYIFAQFESIFSEVKEIFERAAKSFHQVLFRKEPKYINRVYHVFFLAIYELLVKEQRKIADYDGLLKAVTGVGDDLLMKNIDTLNISRPRQQKVDALKGIITKFTEKRGENDPALSNGVMKLEAILSNSKTENTNYDFKIGLHYFGTSNEFNEDVFNKIMKTLAATVNMGKGSIGYVIVGVADNESAAKNYIAYYRGSSFRKFKNFCITGVNDEVNKNYARSDEKYRTNVEQKIKKSSITPTKYIDQILRNFDYFNYYDKSILIFKIGADDEPCRFNNKLYERQGASVVEVSSDKEKEVWRRFLT